jgi:hypothetical protein
MIVVALALRRQPFWESGQNTFLMLVESTVVGAVGGAGIWRFALKPGDRERILKRIRRKPALESEVPVA